MYRQKLQRRWQEQRPAIYDKKTRIVCLDIVKESKKEKVDDGKELVTEGYSFYPIQTDNVIDYAHIKSQLIEAGYAPKDEFGIMANALASVFGILLGNDEDIPASIKEKLAADPDVKACLTFTEYRQMCADAAKEVMKQY